MSQYLIIQGDPSWATPLFEEGCRHLTAWHGVPPHTIWRGTGVLAASFPTLSKRQTVERTSNAEWGCVTGTLYNRGLPAREALERLCQDIGDGGITTPTLAEQMNEIDGNFAAVWTRRSSQEIVVVTDRIGTNHAFACEVDSGLIISNSSLVIAALVRPEWDLASLREYLATGTVFEHRTLWQGIEKLEPATLFQFRDGRLAKKTRYWSLLDHSWDRATERGGVPDLAAALEDAVKKLTTRFPNAIFDLTGGLDSRALVGAAMKIGINPPTAMVGPVADPDVTAAAGVAKAYSLHHIRISEDCTAEEWWEATKAAALLCEGEYDALEFAHILRVHRRLSEEFDASVNGATGEVCKGYWWEVLIPHTGKKGHFDARVVAQRRFVPNEGAAPLLAQGAGDLIGQFAGIIERIDKGWEAMPNSARVDNTYLTMRMQRWQGRIGSTTNRLWPVISPFMFRRILEVALATPAKERIHKRMSRAVIEFLDPRLAALPLSGGYPATPIRLTNLFRFLPLANEYWQLVRGRLFGKAGTGAADHPVARLWAIDEVREVMSPSSMVTRALYDPQRLEAFLEHSQTDQFHSDAEFGRVLTLELAGRAVFQEHAKTDITWAAGHLAAHVTAA